MKLQTLSATTVVLAATHNPSILHPAFLFSKRIVPDEWQADEHVICTPPFSRVGFRNGIQFVAEPERLSISDHNRDSNFSQSPVAELTVKYIETLPHVPYRALGINFQLFAECPDPGLKLLGQFVKEGAWTDRALTPLGAGIALTYVHEKARLTLDMKAGRAALDPSGKQESIGVVLAANYHVDLNQEAAVSEIRESLKTYSERYAYLLKLTERLFP